MLKNLLDSVRAGALMGIVFVCGTELRMNDVVPGSGIDPTFIQYVDDFNGHASKRIRGYCQPEIDMGFGNLGNMPTSKPGSRVIGLCIPGETPTLLIDRRYWEASSELDRESLVYHELGHCVLDLDHDEKMMDVNGTKQPASIMYPESFSAHQYEHMHDYYIDELFASVSPAQEEILRNCGEDVKD